MAAAPPIIDSVEVAQSAPPPAALASPAWHSRRQARVTVLALITLTACVLRFHALGAKSIWLDEGISIAIARLPWSQFFRVLSQREANMALYYLLLRAWMSAGTSETFIRSLSVLFSVATVPLLYVLGARWFGRATGFAAAWLLAINAYHIRYAQEARGYSLLVFLAVLATWLFARNIEGKSTARWGLYSFVAALTIYAHFFGALLVAAHGISLLALAPGKAPWKDFGRSIRWTFLMTVPPVAVVLLNGNASSFWLGRPTWQGLRDFFLAAAGNGGPLLAALSAAALFMTAVFAWRQSQTVGETVQTWTHALLFAWLCAPLGIALAFSLWRPIFLARFFIFCLPALALGVAAGIVRLRPAPAAWLACCVLSVLSLRGANSYYQRDFDLSRDDWRSATSYITSHALPGDAIFFPTFGRLPYEYYKSRYTPRVDGPQVLNFPGAAALESRDFVVRPVAEMLRDARPAPDRVWLVLFLDRTAAGRENPTSAMLRAWFGKNRTLVAQQEFPQIRVYLYARELAPALQAETRDLRIH